MAIRNKTTTVLMAVFVLALGAGVVAGTLVSRLPSSPTGPSSAGEHSPLDELQLNASQREQMRVIWEDVQKLSSQCLVDGQLAQKDRDDTIFKMLNPEQKAQWDRINTELAGKLKALSDRREAAFKKAVDRTESILNDSQRKVYDQMISKRVGQITAGGGFGQPPLANWGSNPGSTYQRSP